MYFVRIVFHGRKPSMYPLTLLNKDGLLPTDKRLIICHHEQQQQQGLKWKGEDVLWQQ